MSDPIFHNPDGSPLTRHQIYGIVQRVGDRAHVVGASPHRLRHSFATHMIEAGASVQDVQRLLGHANIQTTMKYVAVSDNAARKAHSEFHPLAKAGN